jgi:hypothetical protein
MGSGQAAQAPVIIAKSSRLSVQMPSTTNLNSSNEKAKIIHSSVFSSNLERVFATSILDIPNQIPKFKIAKYIQLLESLNQQDLPGINSIN